MKSHNHSVASVSKDSFALLGAFIACIVAVYFAPRFGIPQILVKAGFLGMILVAYTSKNDVFWLSLYFLIINPPGRLFGTSAGDSVFRLPLYSLAPGISFSFQELFLIMYVVKVFLSRKWTDSSYKQPVMALMIYGLIVFCYSWFIGMSSNTIVSAVRVYLPWFWLIIYPAYIKNQQSLLRVFKMLSPYVFVAFALTIQAQITGEYLHSILSGELTTRFLGDAEERLIRATHAMHLSFIVMFLAIYYTSLKEKIISNTYLNLLIVTSALFIFLSATRGWIIATIILLSSFLFMGGYNFFRQTVRVFVVVGIVFFLVSSVYPLLLFQTSEALGRFLTLEALAGGDLTAQGTLGRLTERGPIVMAVFKQSPIIGWGFSSYYFSSADVHVGNQTLLMQGGVIGFILWLGVYVYIALSFVQTGRSRFNNGYNGAKACLMAWLATFAIHSSSMQMLGFAYSQPATHVHWALILTAAQALLRPVTPIHTIQSTTLQLGNVTLR